MPAASIPHLQRLSDLAHAPRIVAVQSGPGALTWCGDLAKPRMHRAYVAMRDHWQSLVEIRHNEGPGQGYLTARIRGGHDPVDSYKAGLRITAWEPPPFPRKQFPEAVMASVDASVVHAARRVLDAWDGSNARSAPARAPLDAALTALADAVAAMDGPTR